MKDAKDTMWSPYWERCDLIRKASGGGATYTLRMRDGGAEVSRTFPYEIVRMEAFDSAFLRPALSAMYRQLIDEQEAMERVFDAMHGDSSGKDSKGPEPSPWRSVGSVVRAVQTWK